MPPHSIYLPTNHLPHHSKKLNTALQNHFLFPSHQPTSLFVGISLFSKKRLTFFYTPASKIYLSMRFIFVVCKH